MPQSLRSPISPFMQRICKCSKRTLEGRAFLCKGRPLQVLPAVKPCSTEGVGFVRTVRQYTLYSMTQRESAFPLGLVRSFLPDTQRWCKVVRSHFASVSEHNSDWMILKTDIILNNLRFALQSDLPELTNSEIFLDQLKLAEHVFEYDKRQSTASKNSSMMVTGPEIALSTVKEREDSEADHQDPPVVVVK